MDLASAHGLVPWDLEFSRPAGRELLTVSVDRPGPTPIDSGSLAAFTESLSRELDRADAVPGSQRYVLEVTSPGAEGRLRSHEQFEACVGRHARVTFKDGRQPVNGVLTAVGPDSVTVGDTVVPFEDISQARLIVPEVR